MMDHPHIAKVLDAGTTSGEVGSVSGGRPYFVMELVKGISITKYCDQEHLTPKERLELLIPVCQAVQHAHQKGIIHRDLKPSNVLVSLFDGKPVPKVIDFGVAKATAQKLTERTMFTEVGQIVGTLEYMAPEQAELTNLDIDTRADIYSLGVILYELLTGSPPFTAKQLRSAAFTEMLRMIREVEPPKPSTKLSSSDELASVAANRHLEPKTLTKLVHGELDWIVMKCLEKNRGRRYETANGLAMDVRRYLTDEPVEACPPSAAYKLKKYAVKYKRVLLLAASFAFLLFSGAIISTWQAVRATLAERRAITAFAAELSAKEAEARQRDRAAEAEAAKAKVEAIKAEEQRVLLESNMKLALKNLGLVYARQTGINNDPKTKQARLEAMENEVALHEEFARKNSATYPVSLRYELGKATLRLGGLYVDLKQWEGAASAYRRAIAILEKLAEQIPEAPEHRWELAIGYYWLGRVLGEVNQRADAMKHLGKSLTVTERLLEETPSNRTYNDHLVSTVYLLAMFADSPQEAAQFNQRKLGPLQRLVELHPTDALAHSRLGDALVGNGDLDGAIAVYRKAVALAPSNPNFWYGLAQSHLTANDGEAHRKVCGEIMQRFAKTKETGVAARVLYACLATSNSLDDMTRLVPLAELAATNNANARLLGAVFCRVGKYDAAIGLLNQGQSRAWDHLFLAMTYHHLGHTDKARQYLERAASQIKSARYPWPEIMESEHLYREAAALINGSGANELPSNQ
jgi:tetratricopeptide (TPR) repeat protein